jgi:6-pyruvoyltetrahydropterin/6-carboxytetrahydropterin synthase
VYYLTVRTDFSAAHAIRGYAGRCSRLHGHNFKVEVVVKGGQLDAIGMLVDFVELKRHIHALLEEYDHTNLNDHEAFRVSNPTAENIALFTFERLQESLPGQVAVHAVTIFETDRLSATYRVDSSGP